jgi:hypothetical protein
VVAAPELAAGVAESAAVADGGKCAMNRKHSKKTELHKSLSRQLGLCGAFVCLSLAAALALHAAPQAPKGPAPREFDTAKHAADALIAAAQTYDVEELKKILGPDSVDLLTSEDPVQDKNIGIQFAAKAKEKTSLVTDPKNSRLVEMVVGNDDWPLPIPIVKRGVRWSFDTKAGREEILLRRIGRNELDAIEICRGFVEAQHEYAKQKHEGAMVNQYAQRIVSTPGKRDGLAWQNPDGSWGGPIGEVIARAIEQGYSDRTEPYRGYFFKILKRQGPAAPLGDLDFVVKGAMLGGFALVAAPAQYEVTGVMTFLVGYDGIVYQKDNGPESLNSFTTMDTYNPDKTWTPVPEEDQ